MNMNQFIIKNWVVILLFGCILNIMYDIHNLESKKDNTIEISKIVKKNVFRYMVGFLGLWGSIGHLFNPVETAKSIGWSSGGFQFEVGLCNVALGIMGVLASLDNASPGFQLATMIFAVCFLGGAGVNHFYEQITANNNAPGNSGFVAYTDIAIPVILLITYFKQYGIKDGLDESL